MRSLLSLAAAACFVASLAFAGAALACDHEHAAITASCPHAKTASHAEGKSCCAGKSATTASTRVESADDYVVPALAIESDASDSSDTGEHHGADCPMHKAHMAMPAMAHGKDCPMHAAMVESKESGHDCPMMKKATAKCSTEAGTAVKRTGKVVCARCELHKADACLSVFQASGEEGFTPLCGEGMAQELLKLTRHGELEVTIQGHLKKGEAGGQVLCVDGFQVGSI